MRKFFRIFIVTFLILNIQIKNTYCDALNLIEEKLEEVGVSKEYSNNIINYISSLKLSDEDANKILEDANDIISNITNKENYSDFTFSELLNIYGEALNIAEGLNINIDVDFSNKEVVLKDKDNKLMLIKCDIDDIKKYYEKYKESPFTYDDYDEVKSYINENNIIEKSDINSNESDDESSKSEIYNNSRLNEEANENNELSDSSYSDTNSNDNETFNRASAIKNKNVNRGLSIIFLVIFACVVISLLMDSIFSNREN